jgi:hypothetical protein
MREDRTLQVHIGGDCLGSFYPHGLLREISQASMNVSSPVLPVFNSANEKLRPSR